MSDDLDDLTRKHLHEITDTVQAVMIKTAVIEERQTRVVEVLARIEATTVSCNTLLSALTTKVAVLEDRMHEARNTAAKWGAGIGAFVSAVIAGLAAFFGGDGK